MTKQDVIDYVMHSPYNTNRAVLSGILDDFETSDNKTEIELLAQENKVYTPEEGKVYNKVTVNVPAPPSDFSTAQVTINKTKSGAASFYGATIMTDSGYSGADELSSGLIMVFGSKETVTVILYKGAAEIQPSNTGSISNVVGNAVLDNGVLIVKGDCEFTLIDQ